MERLVSKIKEQFSREAIIEIYVLDESGSPIELYSGLPHALTSNCLEQVLREPSTFYVFSVVGIDENFADMIDIHRDKMSRKEFCWLTDPRPPLAEMRSNTSLVLKWDPIRFCGVDVSVVSDSITYILEGCEGQEWKGGIASKFVSDISSSEYKLICKGSQLERIVLEDLKPAHWYHFRLTIKYLSTYVTSQTKSYATICSPPNKPNIPYVYLVMNENNMFENKSRQDPQVRLTWNEPSNNGSSIKKYQVQVIELFDNISEIPKGKTHSDNNNYSSHNTNNNHKHNGSNIQYNQDDDDNNNNMMLQRPSSPKSKQLYQYTSPNGQLYIGEKWKTVYCNLVKSTLLESPKHGCKAWGIRLRALNSSGWSHFSDTIYLDNHSYPQLFPLKTFSPPSRDKLPPLQKPSTRNESSILSKSPSKQSHNNNNNNFQQNEGREYHDGHVDMWTASNTNRSSYSTSLNQDENGNISDSNNRTLSRSQSAPHAKYHQPRCKSPSLLFPGSQSSKNNESFNRSISPDPQSPIDSFQLSNNSELSLLELEVERLWERTSINRDFIQLVIENTLMTQENNDKK